MDIRPAVRTIQASTELPSPVRDILSEMLAILQRLDDDVALVRGKVQALERGRETP